MHRKALVNASRIVLTMLLIAAVVLLGLAVAIALLGDPPEVQGWLRTAFGKVFSVVAVGLAAVLGIPAVIGVWAMAGSTRTSATPALPKTLRWILVGVAYRHGGRHGRGAAGHGQRQHGPEPRAARPGRARVARACGRRQLLPHTWRAGLSGLAVVLVALGSAWLLSNAFIGVGA